MKLVFFYLLANLGHAKKCGFRNIEYLAEVAPTPLGEISGGAYVSSGRYWVMNDSEETHPTFYETEQRHFLIWRLLESNKMTGRMDVWFDNLGRKQIYIVDTGGNNDSLIHLKSILFPTPE